ncbi:hypothetical protein GCM10007981_03390 [Thermocladium modestius]|uniref:Thioredoxin domain-containing protein n=2 Tax=Thermocladium modestius TaxID=62609 RepID=A0A830GU19_9CREN|nr:hypothetical protein GCM10007981_03390 [Thermocladium modestius]
MVGMRFRIIIIILMAVALIAAASIVLTLHGSGHGVGITVGDQAPNDWFTLPNGTIIYLDQLRGHYVLLYLVTTWCDACALGVSMLGHDAAAYAARGIYVVILEQYNDLGYQGMPITSFVQSFAGKLPGNFMEGNASLQLTKTFNPTLQLDVYYLVSPNGTIIYRGFNLPNTYGELLPIIAKLK